MNSEDIARICHEANRGLQHVLGSQGIPVAPTWDEFPADQQIGVVNGVEAALEGASAEELHQSWCDFKQNNGWKYGEVKDDRLRTHPCLLPYDQLPEEQRIKDRLFSAIVGVFR